MPDALTAYRSATPWDHVSPHDEALVEELVADQEAACAALQAAIDRALAEIGCLEFPLGFPARGYDKPDALALLRDLMPTMTPQEMTTVAWEMVGD